MSIDRTRLGPVVRAIGLLVVAPGSNPILSSEQNLFPVVPHSTLPYFVNSQLVAPCLLFKVALYSFFFGVRGIGTNGASARVFKNKFYFDNVTKNKGF